MSYRHAGFTLLELVLTVAIAMTLLSIGIPSYQQVTKQNRLSTEANNLLLNVNFARSESIKKSRSVVMCKSANVTATLPSCTENHAWDQGWIVFEDDDRDKVLDAEELPVLRLQSKIQGSLTLTGSDEFADLVRFIPDGTAKGADGSSGGRFTLCSGDQGRELSISNIGRPKIIKVGCGGS